MTITYNKAKKAHKKTQKGHLQVIKENKQQRPKGSSILKHRKQTTITKKFTYKVVEKTHNRYQKGHL